MAYYLERLQATADGDGSLLDHTHIVYGRGMSDSNAHQPIDLPIAVFSPICAAAATSATRARR